MAGPIRVQGTTEDLLTNATLSGAAGTLAFDGHIDLYPPSYGVSGSGHFVGLDPSVNVESPKLPKGLLDGDYTVDLRWDSIANPLATLKGSASLTLAPSTFDGVHVFDGRLYARFVEEKVHVDTLRLETAAATLTAKGALGLAVGTTD